MIETNIRSKTDIMITCNLLIFKIKLMMKAEHSRAKVNVPSAGGAASFFGTGTFFSGTGFFGTSGTLKESFKNGGGLVFRMVVQSTVLNDSFIKHTYHETTEESKLCSHHTKQQVAQH